MRKPLLLFISLLIIKSFATSVLAQTSENGADLRVMTYNLKYDDKSDPLNNWANRKDNVIGLINYHKPLVFGTQEGLYHQIEDIKEGLSSYNYIGVARDDGGQKGEYSAIFYDTEEIEIRQSGTFWLSRTPDKPSKSWDAALPRICTWAEMLHKKSGTIFYYFNTHFDHVGVRAREESASLILKKIEGMAAGYPAILSGDFNFEPDKLPYLVVTEALSDSFIETQTEPYGPEATFNGFHFEEKPTRRIDYIFVNPRVQVLQYATLSDSKDMGYPSDHFPVLADIKFN